MQENEITPEVPQAPETIHQPEPVYQPSTTSPATQPKPPFFTFNFNTLLGFVLLAGLAVLYYLHFAAACSTGATTAVPVVKPDGQATTVVFLNIDSLNANYEYVKILRRDLEGTGKKLQADVLGEQAALEKEAADFQRRIASNAITEEKAKAEYEILMQKQQALMEKKERYTQQVAEQEMNMNLQLVDSVTAFLKRYNREFRYDYIMGFKTGGEILVANDTLDITRSVLDALNKEYNERKK